MSTETTETQPLGTLLEIPVELGAISDPPVWETHKRGKNWAAFISKDPSAPGGLHREFFSFGRGGYRYILPATIRRGRALEFGADYYSGSGNPHRHRWYGAVVDVREDLLTIEETDTAAKAIALAATL